MSAEQRYSAWQDLGPAVRVQAHDELVAECKTIGSQVRDAYLLHVSKFGIMTRPEYVRKLESTNAELWQAKCADIFQDLNRGGTAA